MNDPTTQIPRIIAVKTRQIAAAYEIRVGNGLLAECGEWARQCLPAGTEKLAIISNKKVFGLYGALTEAGFRRAGFNVFHWLMADGERHKNMRSLEAALAFLSDAKIGRTDAVVGLGGGVTGDLAGFAASVYLRGISFLQIPTTLLAMIDSSTGGKTGINTAYGKNLIGAFHQPAGVLADVSTLRTLPRREIAAGFCEAVKHGALSGKQLLRETGRLLERFPPSRFANSFESEDLRIDLATLIRDQIGFKASIVASDEREDPGSTGAGSRKILNFGHTFAHAIEKITEYKYFRHGEAVGYGIIFAAELSKKLEILAEDELKLLNDVVHRCGPLPRLTNIDPNAVADAMRFDKKLVSGSLQWVLLEGIGNPVIVSEDNIPQEAVVETLNKILHA